MLHTHNTKKYSVVPKSLSQEARFKILGKLFNLLKSQSPETQNSDLCNGYEH